MMTLNDGEFTTILDQKITPWSPPELRPPGDDEAGLGDFLRNLHAGYSMALCQNLATNN